MANVMKKAPLAVAIVFVLALGGARGAGAQPSAFATLVAAAKAEGTVVVNGPPIDTVREAITEDFERTFGIPVTYIAGNASQMGARVRAERAAGKYVLDVFLSGPDVVLQTFLPNGWLDPVEPALIAPDVVDPHKWVDGHLWYADPKHTVLRVQRFTAPEVAINTSLVKRGDIASWQSLLDPKWKGKIVAKDPLIEGAGSVLVSYFYLAFGADFVRRLYIDQHPTISGDPRQAVQWLAQGTAAIVVGPDYPTIVEFQKLGYPVTAIFPQGPGLLTGGYGLIGLMNHEPHPNAAKLFVNWLAGKQGQNSLANAAIAVSLRTDVTYHNVPAFMFPEKNRQYIDSYGYAFVTKDRAAALDKARALLENQ
jgi:iron(III) transport system substrate-binding protein